MRAEFDVTKINTLHQIYLNALEHLASLLPCKPHPYHIRKHFADTYWLTLPDTKISTLQKLASEMSTTDTCFDDLVGIIEYLKMHYLTKNYTGPILKHEGRIELKEVSGEWRFPNGQPLPTAPQIIECQINQTA